MIGRTNVGGGKPEEEKTVTAGTSAKVVTPSSGKVLKKVVVNPTPTESKTVTAGTSAKVVTPSSGKHLNRVTVNPTPSQAKTVTPIRSTQIAKPDSGKLLSQVTVDSIPPFIYSEKIRAVMNANWTATNHGTMAPLKGSLATIDGTSQFFAVSGSYKFYGAEASQGLTKTAATSGIKNMRGAATDGKNVFMIADPAGSEATPFLIGQTVAAFKGSQGIARWLYSSTDILFNDIIAFPSGKVVAIGSWGSGEALIYVINANGSTVTSTTDLNDYVENTVYSTSYGTSYLKGVYCPKLHKIAAITDTGKVVLIDENGNTSLHPLTSSLPSDFISKVCTDSDEYFVVAGMRNDGTYIYYTPLDSVSLRGFKISNDILDLSGIGYANGLYLMAYTDTDGKTKLWTSDDITSRDMIAIPSKNNLNVIKIPVSIFATSPTAFNAIANDTTSTYTYKTRIVVPD